MPTDNDLLHILKVNNIDLASVVPKIEFYKIVRDKNGKKVKEIYILMHMMLENMLKIYTETKNSEATMLE